MLSPVREKAFVFYILTIRQRRSHSGPSLSLAAGKRISHQRQRVVLLVFLPSEPLDTLTGAHPNYTRDEALQQAIARQTLVKSFHYIDAQYFRTIRVTRDSLGTNPLCPHKYNLSLNRQHWSMRVSTVAAREMGSYNDLPVDSAKRYYCCKSTVTIGSVKSSITIRVLVSSTGLCYHPRFPTHSVKDHSYI